MLRSFYTESVLCANSQNPQLTRGEEYFDPMSTDDLLLT